MGAKRNSLLAAATLSLFIATGCLAANADTPALSDIQLSEMSAESAYFSKTLALALDLRPTRLITADEFKAKRSLDDAIILDTRSAKAYAKSHIEGAINLPLTEMTELSLAAALPSRTVPILIYSDQNFGTAPGLIPHDSSDLSLNLLSFLALNQYGYANVHELGERLAFDDPRIDWNTAEQTTQIALNSAQPARLD